MASEFSVIEKIRILTAEKPVLVTGSAGFIGFHTCRRLLDAGIQVVGLDNLNDYYDVSLKRDRLQKLAGPDFDFSKLDIADFKAVESIFDEIQPKLVIHLAAQPGVRYSLINPQAYGQSNLIGTLNLLEACKQVETSHLVFASSSSVYGANKELPFKIQDNVDHPVSLYAATKKSCELMSHAYSHLYQLPVTGLRFFTVYGPWGRPDMAYFSFARSILAGESIKVFNQGEMRRDFTYIDDIVEGVLRVCGRPPVSGNQGTGPFRLYNIGNNKPENLMYMIELLEGYLGKQASKEFLPMQPGDVKETYADISELESEFDYQPTTSLQEGLKKFVEWYREYYGDK